MARSIPDIKKPAKRVGRPRVTGTGTIIGTRWHEPDLVAIDAWRNNHPDKPDRAEAIRRLVRAGLAAVTTEVETLPTRSRKRSR